MIKLNKRLVVSIVYIITGTSYGQNYIDLNQKKIDYEFKSSALFGSGNKSLDLTPYQTSNNIPNGRYLSNIMVNGKEITKEMISFEKDDENNESNLCLSLNLLNEFDLTPQVLENLPSTECISVKDINSDASYKFNLKTQTLNISIPLISLNNRPLGYISPSRFSDGVTSAFINYNYNYYNSKINNDNNYSFDTHYLSISAGINLGGWYFRHQSGTSHNDKGTQFDSNLNVFYKDLPDNLSRLSLGQFYTSTYRLESLPIIGAQISTDQTMRPWSQRNYAPVIENIASSNAIVSIYQNGRKLLEKTVPAGPFKINDLNAYSGNGDLTVNITENTGATRTYIVPLQSNANLVREGQLNHSLSIGRYRLQNHTTNTTIGQASLEYGLNNYSTVHLGTNISDIYQSYLVGSSFNTLFGGFNLSADIARAQIYDNWLNGERYRVDYRFNLNTFGSTSLNAFYLNQGRKYKSVSNTFSYQNRDQLSYAEIEDFLLTNNLKQQYSVAIGQKLSKDFGSINFNIFRSNYWNDDKTYNQYSISYSNRWKEATYNLGFSQSENPNQTDNKLMYLSLSMPLDWRKSKINLNANIQRLSAENKSLYSTVNMSSVLGSNNQIAYSLGVSNSHSDGKSESYLGGQVSYLLPQMTVGATFSTLGDNKQYSLSSSGAIVAHPHGITLTNFLGDTFAIAHIKNGQGAEIQNSAGIRFDKWGNAIYSNMNPYDENILQINPSALPVNVSMDSTQKVIIPRRYSSTMALFDATVNSNIILVLSLKNNETLPIGTELKDAENHKIGVVGQSNQVLVSSLDLLKKTSVLKWREDEDQQCSLKPLELDTKLSSTHFNIINAECN